MLTGVVITSACGPTIAVENAVAVEVVESGWFDAGMVGGQNKLVPAARVKVKNISPEKLVMLQINSLFRQVNSTDEWGTAFLTVGPDALEPGQDRTILLKSGNGYTGSGETRQEMMKNGHFVDAKVEVLAKYASLQWKKMGEFPITRQLLEK